MNDKLHDYHRTLQLGNTLLIYIQELQNNVQRAQHANLFDRNPYIRSRQAKANIKAVEDAVEHCLTTILHYTAALAKQNICNSKELHQYFYVYSFLYQYHNDVERQELGHRLLSKDVELTSRLYRFIEESKVFVKRQLERIQVKQNVS